MNPLASENCTNNTDQFPITLCFASSEQLGLEIHEEETAAKRQFRVTSIQRGKQASRYRALGLRPNILINLVNGIPTGALATACDPSVVNMDAFDSAYMPSYHPAGRLSLQDLHVLMEHRPVEITFASVSYTHLTLPTKA